MSRLPDPRLAALLERLHTRSAGENIGRRDLRWVRERAGSAAARSHARPLPDGRERRPG